jgi:hypothetical protein
MRSERTIRIAKTALLLAAMTVFLTGCHHFWHHHHHHHRGDVPAIVPG